MVKQKCCSVPKGYLPPELDDPPQIGLLFSRTVPTPLTLNGAKDRSHRQPFEFAIRLEKYVFLQELHEYSDRNLAYTDQPGQAGCRSEYPCNFFAKIKIFPI